MDQPRGDIWPDADGFFAGPGYRLAWRGSQRAMLAGDIEGHVSLDGLADTPGLAALGPGEGVVGEATACDDDRHFTVARDGAVVASDWQGRRCCFMVWASVPVWREVELVAVHSLEDVTTAAPVLARAAGVDSTAPFPVRIEAKLVEGSFHILDRCGDKPHSPAEHERAKVHFELGAEPVTIIAFVAPAHQGVFVPPHTPVHAHVIARGGAVSGHLEAAEFSSLRAFVPAAGD
jgi:hypothetical protein